MKNCIDILLISVCLWIFIQDLRERMISVFLLGILLALLVFRFYVYGNSNGNQSVLLANFLFITGQVGFLFVYFKFIKNSKQNFLTELFGLGDVILMFCMAFVFPLPALILFFLTSYILGITFCLAYMVRKKNITIPLAGIMSLLYATIILSLLIIGYSPLTPFSA